MALFDKNQDGFISVDEFYEFTSQFMPEEGIIRIANKIDFDRASLPQF